MNGKKPNSQQALQKARRILREQGISTKRKFVAITCTACGTEVRIRTDRKEMYTEEVRKKFTCLLCDSRLRKRARIGGVVNTFNPNRKFEATPVRTVCKNQLTEGNTNKEV
jgi:hypothetical protein